MNAQVNKKNEILSSCIEEISDESNHVLQEVKMKNSVFGIISFILSLLTAILFMSMIIATIFVSESSANETTYAIVGVVFFLDLFLGTIGIGCGIIGALSKNTKKVLALLGLVINISSVISLSVFILY